MNPADLEHRRPCPTSRSADCGGRRQHGAYGHRLNLYRDTRPHAGFGPLKQWGQRMEPGADLLRKARQPLVVELGAGVAIPSVRHFGQAVIRHHNGRMIRINPHEPQVAGPHDVGLAANALQALSAINALL